MSANERTTGDHTGQNHVQTTDDHTGQNHVQTTDDRKGPRHMATTGDHTDPRHMATTGDHKSQETTGDHKGPPNPSISPLAPTIRRGDARAQRVPDRFHVHLFVCPRRSSPVCVALLLLLVLLAGCAQSSANVGAGSTPTATKTLPTPTATVPAPPTPTATPTPRPAPASYTAHTILQGAARPDDLAFDNQGRLLFSDEFTDTISRLNADGSITVIVRDPTGPEGMVVLPDGTLIYAQQATNRIVSLAPGATTPHVLRTLPGTPSNANCKHGVDGIALDQTNNTLIIPDSPTGAVYRMSLNGQTFTLLATDITRPVGASVDSQGNIYVADECGGAVWRITPGGVKTRLGGFGMPDDVIPDGYGNLLVIDLEPSIHALIRLNPSTGQHQTLASRGYIEPQGIVMDTQGNIFVSDDYADIIVKYVPA